VRFFMKWQYPFANLLLKDRLAIFQPNCQCTNRRYEKMRSSDSLFRVAFPQGNISI